MASSCQAEYSASASRTKWWWPWSQMYVLGERIDVLATRSLSSSTVDRHPSGSAG